MWMIHTHTNTHTHINVCMHAYVCAFLSEIDRSTNPIVLITDIL